MHGESEDQASQMPQWVKVPPAKPANLVQASRTRVAGRTNSFELLSDLHTRTVAHVHTHSE